MGYGPSNVRSTLPQGKYILGNICSDLEKCLLSAGSEKLRSLKIGLFQVVCPNAPLAKVTLNMGMEMPSWYDIYHLDDNPNRPRENLEDVQQSVQYLQSIIQNETGMLKLQVASTKAFTFDNFT